MKIVFLDTETTGTEKHDRLCQVAYKVDNKVVNEMFKPPLPICVEAMATHHITNKMVAEKPMFEGSDAWVELRQLLGNENSVLVAHNAKFDVGMLVKENVLPKKYICTLKVARWLDEQEKIQSYALQYLRYLLDIEIEATAHDALGDILVLEKLYDRLLAKVIHNVGSDSNALDGATSDEIEKAAVEAMIEISSQPSLIKTFKFGKHINKKLADVAKSDRGYLEWLYGQKSNEPEPDEDWLYTLKYYLGMPQ